MFDVLCDIEREVFAKFVEDGLHDARIVGYIHLHL